MKTKVFKYQNGLFVELPKKYTKFLNIKENDKLNIDLNVEANQISIYKNGNEDNDELLDIESNEDF